MTGRYRPVIGKSREGSDIVRRPSTRVRAGLAGGLTVVLLGLSSGSPATALGRDKPTPTKHQVAQAQGAARKAATDVGSAQARLATLRAKLDRLNRNAEIAGEAYDGAVYKLGLATKAAKQAQRRADLAQQQYDAAHRVVGTFAAAAYRSGANLGPADIFLGVGGPGGAVARADAIGAVGAKVQRALQTAQSTKIVASVLREQANAALAAQSKAELAVATAKQRADHAVAEQESKVYGLNAQISTLEHRLALAKAHASHLQTARQTGLAKAALEREKARQRAAALAEAKRVATQLAAARDAANAQTDNSPVIAVGGSSHGTTAGAARAIAFAKRQLGKPYVYAADGPNSFDCSGLTMRAWEAGGVSLPHWSVAQYEQSQPVSSSNARAGDLVFFSSDPNDYRSIYHVGLYLGGGLMIEAPHTGDVVKIIAVYPNDFFGYARP
jgi:cell wall-associated NlpC family hydrolase